jgi:hypothetical protein
MQTKHLAKARRIALIGLTNQDNVLVKSVVSLASGLEIGDWSHTENVDAADVVIVDIESELGRTEWERASSASPSRRYQLLGLTVNDGAKTTDVYGVTIIKPLTYPKLVNALKEFENNLELPTLYNRQPERSSVLQELPIQESQSLISSAQRSVDDQETTKVLVLEQKSVNTNKAFRPVPRLIGLVQETVRQGKTVLLIHPGFPPLKIFPEGGWFVFDGDIDEHPQLFEADASEFQLKVTETDIKSELINGKLPNPLGSLLYRAALYGSGGRLFEGDGENDKIRLRYTPNFHFLPHNSRHIILAEHFSTHVSTIEAASKATGIPPGEVINFVNACNMINAIETISTDSIHEPPSNPISPSIEKDEEFSGEELYPAKKSGLLESIWSRWSQSNSR